MSEVGKCPFRMRALDHPDTCDPRCKWFDGGECAVATIADSLVVIAGMKLMDAQERGVAEDD